MEPADKKLIEEYKKGDKKSLEVLFGRYLKPVYSFVFRYIGGNREEAENIVQETFLKAWKNLGKFDASKSFKTWIFSIAKNSATDWLRKKKPLVFSQFETEEGNILADNLKDESPLPDELFAKKELAELASRAVMELSPQYRAVMFLHYNDHFTLEETAEILGEPVNTVKSRHRRAIICLKKKLLEI